MATQDELWQLIAASREGTLATVARSGGPQLSNILYVPDPATRQVSISATADRVKSQNLARTPRGALYVVGGDFWHYAVGYGTATLSAVATTPGDPATDELAALYAALFGEEADRATFDGRQVAEKRLVIRLQITRLTGVIAPVPARFASLPRPGRDS